MEVRAFSQVPRVALIVPAFNEAKSLPSLFREVESANSAGADLCLWVVNDGSRDSTEEFLARYARTHAKARFVSLPLNLGIGRAVQTGLRAAITDSAEIFVQLDGDGQHPPGEVEKLIAPLLAGKADWVVGSRYLPGAGGAVSSSLRRLGTLFFSFWIRLLTGQRVSDPTSGFRAWNRHAVQLLAPVYPDDYPEVQSLVTAHRLGLRVAEVPVSMRPRKAGRSSITPIGSVYYMVKVALAAAVEVVRSLEERR